MKGADEASVFGLLRLLGETFRWAITDRVARVLTSSFVLLMLWGTHGELDLLKLVVPHWTGPGGSPSTRAHLLPGVPWDQEWIAFAAGALLLVVVPCALIRWVFHERIRDYGLGLPRPGTWRFTAVSTLVLAAFAVPSMLLAARDPAMRAVYPLFRSFADGHQFALYEAGYFVFFLVIEFTFRGYLLFGLYRVKDSMAGRAPLGAEGPRIFDMYAVLVSMLSYTAWHLGKPLAEQYGTLLWGIVTGVMVLRSGTIWHVVFVHFGMNVLLDYLIWTS